MKPRSREAGAVLLIFALLVMLAAFAAWAALARTRAGAPVAQAQQLAAARHLVLGYAAANPRRPGELPFPDRRGDGNYDGSGDCIPVTTDVLGAHLLGQWPWRLEQGCGTERQAFGTTFHDGAGNRFWYAVSRNLTYAAPALHSGLAGDWLQVRDRHGVAVTHDAAVVLVAPGAAVAGQSRTALSPPAAYLDTVAGGTALANSDDDGDYVAAVASDSFNDQILFITRQELFAAVTRRVAHTLALRLDAFHAAYGSYPAAADSDGVCRASLEQGGFPLLAGECPAIPETPAPWFAANWAAATLYRRIAGDRVELRFAGCAIVYQLSPGQLTESARQC